MVDTQSIQPPKTCILNDNTHPPKASADVHVLTILTGMPISNREIPLFRGAVIHLTKESDELFHDHHGSGFRYSYPLIQYKIIDGHAAIVAVNEGTKAAKSLLPFMNSKIQLGQRFADLLLSDMVSSDRTVATSNEPHSYMMRRWLPLNQENYSLYNRLEDASQRIKMLERLLTANILSFAKGVGIFMESTIDVRIVDIKEIKQLRYKNIQMLGFNLLFKTNVTLPSYIGLGKGASLGFGTITKQ